MEGDTRWAQEITIAAMTVLAGLLLIVAGLAW
jgi:hypothetical protein